MRAKVRSKEGRMNTAILEKGFSEEGTQGFIAKCKRSGVSVTAGLFATAAIVGSAKKKFNATMPISYRTKDDWGDVAVSFTDAGFSLDLASIWEENERRGEGNEALWAAIAGEFHREIRRKLGSERDKFSGMAVGFLYSALEEFKADDTSDVSLCTGPSNDEFSILVSNVGVVDGYFVEKEGDSLSVEEVLAFCGNAICPLLIVWCYTFRGKFRMVFLDATVSPKRKIFDEFADKVSEYVEMESK